MVDQPTRTDRRKPDRQHPILGGRRASDPPLSTGDCADWMGVGRDFIRGAIAETDPSKRLEAERVYVNGRLLIRIHLDDFCAWLKKIGWKRLPRELPPTDPPKHDTRSPEPSSPSAPAA